MQQEQINEQILKFFIKKGFLLDKALLNFFSQLENNALAEDIVTKISMMTKVRVVNKAMIEENIEEIRPLFLDQEKEKLDLFNEFFKPQKVKQEEKAKEKEEKEDFVPGFKILSSNITPDRKIEVKDFVKHFKNRYNVLKDLLRDRKELTNLMSIDKIGNNRDLSIIGLVNNKRVTKNKNILLEVEDPTGRINVLINQNREEVFEKAKEIILDDVVGFRCSSGGDILFANDVFFPDVFLDQKKRLDEEIYAVFISDMHIGSNNFLEKNFSRFIDWLNCKGCDEEQRKKIEKIRYMFIVGDSVDGVGIFPGQEKVLEIDNMKDQYIKLASYLEKIPKHITIIMCPGQHDAVRVPEPQPPVDEDFAEPLTKLENLFLVSNPSLIEIGSTKTKDGFKVLMYHGASIHSWISEIEDLRMGKTNLNPAKAIKYLLRHRHLSPTHSATTYVPDENEDPMVIKQIPDVMVTGDMHRTDVDMYNNILIVCSSCWQSITPFEEKVGNDPDPCKVPMLNLNTREIKILDFSDEGGK